MGILTAAPPQDARLKLARYKAEKNKSALERMWDTRVNKYRDGG